MSRGFVKEEDQEEAPFIPPRAALPPGETNYVTPQGYRGLLQEREELENSRRNLEIEDEKERRHATTLIDGKLNLLNERIASAKIIKPENQIKKEVRFGATVKFKFLNGSKEDLVQEFTVVGVDEANIKNLKISFLAPLARAITGKRVGDIVTVFIAGKQQEIKILNITYS